MRSASTDDTVDPDFTGIPYADNIPADIVSVRGDETYRGHQVEKYIDFVIEVPYDHDITPDMRLRVATGVHAGETLKIRQARHMPYRNGCPPETWLFCRRSTSAVADE
jgi:head-tail adaptor